MKKLLLVFSCLFSCACCFSQDTIVKVNKEQIQAKILEVGITEIKYKRFDNPEGPVFVLLKSEIARIHFENGTINDITTVTKSETTTTPTLTSEELYIKG